MVLQSLIPWEPASICNLALLCVSLRQKFQNGPSINFLLLNDFTHKNYKKEECHEQYISSSDIYNYKTKLLVPQVVIDWRLCNNKVVDFPVKTFFTCIRPYSSCYVQTWDGGREGGRVRIRKIKRERLIPSWRTTIKTQCQPAYLPKTLFPKPITLRVKKGHN